MKNTKVNYIATGWGDRQKNDDIKLETLFYLLENAPLSKEFEDFGDFMTKRPDNGSVKFWGNFWGISCAFDVETTNPTLINKLTTLIDMNKQRDDYKIQGKISQFCIHYHEGIPDLIEVYRPVNFNRPTRYRATPKRVAMIEQCNELKRIQNHGGLSRRVWFVRNVRPPREEVYPVFNEAYRMINQTNGNE